MRPLWIIWTIINSHFSALPHFPAKAGTFSLTSKCKLCKLTLKDEELCFSTMFVLCYETLVFALVTFPLFSNALFIYNTPATNLRSERSFDPRDCGRDFKCSPERLPSATLIAA